MSGVRTPELSVVRTLLLPVLMTTAAFLLTWPLSAWARQPVFLFFVAAVLACSYWGRWPAGSVATLLSCLAASFALMPPLGSFQIDDPFSRVRLLAFVLVSAIGIGIVERMARLLRRERLLNALITTTPALTVLTDASGRIVMFNRQCEQVTGYRRNEVLGRTIPELFLPAEWTAEVERRFADIASPALQLPHDNPWRCKDGQLRLIEWRCIAVPQDGGGKPYVLGIGIDVTEVRDSHRRIREMDRASAQGELASVIAHELHNPMQALTNVFALLDGSGANEVQWREYLRLAEEQLRRMTDVSHRLTAPRASRGESETPPAGRTPPTAAAV